MFFWNKICGLGIFFVSTCFYLQAQTSSHVQFINKYSSYQIKAGTNSVLHYKTPLTPFVHIQRLEPPVSADFSTCNYGFFCREELKVEKATKIPIRFRLGSLEQCNYYEGKKQ